MPSLEKFSCIDKEYLKYNAGKDTETKMMKVLEKGNTPQNSGAYDAANEIGRLYTSGGGS